MGEKIKNIIITSGFVAIIIIVFIMNLFVKDIEISIAERRRLAQFPKITKEEIKSGKTMKNFDNYAVDQFIYRDFFREIKAICSLKFFMQKNNNNIFEKDGAIYQMNYPLNEKNIQKSTEEINKVYEKYLKGMNVYYSIIPEKNYYLENDDHLKIDYNKLKNIMNNELANMQYIDIWNSLKIEDYYKTDLHWKQENLLKVVDKIKSSMNLEEKNVDYKKLDKGNFYGSYYGQLGFDIEPDKLYVLTNETIESCTVFNYEKQESVPVYNEKTSADRYDIYLSGATPLITIENPTVNTEKELLLFRDSFGSSLAPLLIENYSKITLIDLRYMSSSILDQYIKFENQDVLFLYSSLVLNQNVLK